MSWLAAWFVAVGAADLLRGAAESRRFAPRRLFALAGGALAAGASSALFGRPWNEALLIAGGALLALVIAFELRALEAAGRVPRTALAVPWFTLVSLALMLTASPRPAAGAQPAGLWRDNPWLSALGFGPGELHLVIGCALLLMATANGFVRALLLATGVKLQQAENDLRGGRLIGPLERLLIFGFALAGDLTGAALIASAKSLLRFPELSKEEKEKLHRVTEYFLVGSLTSWLVALAAAALCHLALR